MDASAPTWFTDAQTRPGEDGEVVVDGAPIHYLAWGDRADRTLVLVHGGAAHARWWSPLAPMLAGDHRVLAIDLSGHGSSGWREMYSASTWADEILAVAADGGGGGRPIVVGHSMGGFVTIVAAAEHGPELEGAVVLDSPVTRPDPETEEGRRSSRGMFRAPKTYPDLDTALGHFHLVPPQPTRHPWLIDHVARHSLREVPATTDAPGGWTWRFDPRIFVHRSGPNRPSDYGPKLAQAGCRLAFVNGERSAIVDDEVVAYIREMVEGSPAAAAGIPFVHVPDAHHHLLLDEPLATVTALRAITATWHPVGAQPATVPTPATPPTP
jgi:pimeloyl-ACP methyl ester carboxylesterase